MRKSGFNVVFRRGEVTSEKYRTLKTSGQAPADVDERKFRNVTKAAIKRRLAKKKIVIRLSAEIMHVGLIYCSSFHVPNITLFMIQMASARTDVINQFIKERQWLPQNYNQSNNKRSSTGCKSSPRNRLWRIWRQKEDYKLKTADWTLYELLLQWPTSSLTPQDMWIQLWLSTLDECPDAFTAILK